MFSFNGELEISKSWMNRALILKSYFQNINIIGQSNSDDVVFLQKALEDLKLQKKIFYAGLGGTTFRFLALRLSREVGTFEIKVDAALLKRPQTELIEILKQLNVKSYFQPQDNSFFIESNGWVPTLSQDQICRVSVDVTESSQFLSSLALNCLNLPFAIEIEITQKNNSEKMKSEDYWLYTLALLKTCGIKVEQKNNLYKIAAHQKTISHELRGELDVSSAFSLIAAGLISGDVTITNWKPNSLQPDYRFLEIFKLMGIQFTESENIFHIKQQLSYQAVKFNLSQCPDLFPVLAVVCAFAQGESHLFGAPQLKHKESDRIAKTTELLTRCGFHIQPLNDGAIITGNPHQQYKLKDVILFDVAHDHRMAFAASLIILKGFPIKINDESAINKSYPQFYQHCGLNELDAILQKKLNEKNQAKLAQESRKN